MSFPSTHHTSPDRPSASQGSRQGSNGLPRSSTCHPLPAEGDHQLEKLEFALAIALTKGDTQRSRQLREEIDRLGGNREEPGT
jgi:hypothetical protein